MGRSGIAMTFVTHQELRDLKSLVRINRIKPVWHGNIPDLQNIQRKEFQGPRIRGLRHYKEKGVTRTLNPMNP
jgi:hypothetical protein